MTVLTKKLAKDNPSCPLCGNSYVALQAAADLRAKAKGKAKGQSQIVCDHDHVTGRVRGVLCRSCNGAEGKVANAVAAWGKAGQDYSKVIPWLERMIKFLKAPQQPYIYPTHLSKEEKAKAAGDKRKQAAMAKAKARQAAVKK